MYHTYIHIVRSDGTSVHIMYVFFSRRPRWHGHAENRPQTEEARCVGTCNFHFFVGLIIPCIFALHVIYSYLLFFVYFYSLFSLHL
jgi:hypothetical protein